MNRGIENSKLREGRKKRERKWWKGVLKGKQWMGTNRINGRQGTLNGFYIGSVTFPLQNYILLVDIYF